MESAHSHHHHLHDQLVGSSASSLPTPSCYGVGFTPHADASTPSFLSTNGFTILNPREDNLLSSHYTTSMSPDLGFNWANNSTDNFTVHPYRKDLEHSSIKEELADLYYHKYTQISERTDEDEQTSMYQIDLRTKLLMNMIPSSDLYSAANNERGFCQILPRVDAQSHNQSGLKNARALHMNLEAVDLLAPSLQNQTGILRDGFSFGFDRMQQSLQVPFYGSDMVSSPSSNAAIEATRDKYKIQPRAQIQNAPKKLRLEARSSCPPFKVRKEKLGDRIAALQQLVAPFGKTDTASVLMEAIGYIKFLQNQVEVHTDKLQKTFFLTLSMPYMKASRIKSNRVLNGDLGENQNEEPKRDLESRGLCLVPLSCLSYITDGGGAAISPPPHFGGAT